MAERLEQRSGGKMRIDLYPGAQLGGERELMELLQIGSIALTKVSTSPLESFVPEYMVFSIPYVFRDEAHFWQVLDGELGQELLEAGEAVRLRGLGFYDAGTRSFYTTDTPVRTPEARPQDWRTKQHDFRGHDSGAGWCRHADSPSYTPPCSRA